MDVPFVRIELARPGWLAALLLALPVIYACRWSLTGFSRPRQTASLACRVLLMVVLVLALAGPRLVQSSRRQFIVLAVDRSQSIAGPSLRKGEAFLREVFEAAGDDRVAMVPFAGRLAAVELSHVDPGVPLDAEGTNLAAAIEVACGAIPSDRVPRVVLLTDGIQTEGDALRAAKALRVPISTVPLQSRSRPEVYVSAVQAAGQVREGEPFSIEVVLHSSHDDEGRVRVFRDDELVGEQKVAVSPGESRIGFRQSLRGQRPATFTAHIEGFKDTISENNRAGVVVFTLPRARALLVEGEPAGGRRLAAALEGEGLDVEVRRPDEVPESLADLRDDALLVLVNVPARALSQTQMDTLQGYVQDFGGGLLVIGGDRAFTPGGYRNTTLEEILPVWCELGQTPKRPGAALVLVIDRSGSMEKGGAIELAKEAARQAVALLGPQDQVGIIAFQDSSRWVCELRPCSDKEHVLRQIDTITAGGGTDMYPAMHKAYLALDEAFAELKHMIVLTDGVSHPGDFDALAKEVAASGITVSTVAVGREAVRPLLENIARLGGGRDYYCDSPAAIPSVFALETAGATRLGIVEEPFRPRPEGPLRALVDLDLQTIPSLLGYVQTRAKPASHLALTTERGDPLLAWWQCGRGVAVAFTSDVRDRWAAAWLRWPQFPRFWSQLARHAVRKADNESFELRIDEHNRLAAVTLDAIDPSGTYLNGAAGVLAVVDPKQTRREIPLMQVGPGRYCLDFAASLPGTYYLDLRLEHAGRLVCRQRRGLVVGYPDELRTRPTDHGLLRAIAETTGGTYDPKPADVLAPSRQTVRQIRPLWPCLLIALAVMFVIDVAIRRVPLPRPARADADDLSFASTTET